MYQAANLGPSAQMQRLDMVAQPSKEERKSKKQKLSEADRKLDREMSHKATLRAVTNLSDRPDQLAPAGSDFQSPPRQADRRPSLAGKFVHEHAHSMLDVV